MSVSSIDGGATALSDLTQSTQSSHHRRQADLSNTAQLLGMSSDQLASNLRSGTTLSSLASTAGVTSSNLLSSVEADLKAGAPQGAPALSESQLNRMATNLISGVGPGGAGAPERSGGAPQTQAMTNTAQLLGVTSDQLASDLQSGDTLSSLASTGGVSSSDLLSSVEADLKANAPEGAPSLSDTQLADMATNIINGTGPGGVGSAGASSSGRATDNLNSVADSLGLDSKDLLSQIQSGGDLSQLLGSAGETGYGSTVADTINGGLVVDQYA